MTPRLGAACALMLLAALPAKAEDAAPVTLVTPVVYGTHLAGLGTPSVDLARLIKERSGGSLVLDLKQPGEGIDPNDILDKVSDGSVDAGFATASFWAADIPAAPLFSGFPFGPDGKTYLDWFDTGNGRKLYQELYDHEGYKVHVLPCALGGAETAGWFATEIAGKQDFENLRMRIFGLGARVMAKLGATTMIVPGAGLARAFDKKEIGAAELYPPAADRQQGVQEKVKLIYVPGWHQPETVFELIVNRERWDGMSAEQRTLIEGACRDLLRTTLQQSARLQVETLAKFRREDGVKIETLPYDVLAALRAAWAEVAKEEGERDYFFQEVLADIEKFRARNARAATQENTPASPPPQVSPKARPPAGP